MINYKVIDILDDNSSYYFFNNYLLINKKKGKSKNNFILNIDLNKNVNNQILIKIELNFNQKNRLINEQLYILINKDIINFKLLNNSIEINSINYLNKKVIIEINNIFKNENLYLFNYQIYNGNYLNMFQTESKDLVKNTNKLMINSNIFGNNNMIISNNFENIYNIINYSNKFNFQINDKNKKFPNLKLNILNNTKIKYTSIIPNIITPLISEKSEVINNIEYNYITYNFKENLEFEPYIDINLGSLNDLRQKYLNYNWIPDNNIILIDNNTEIILENNMNIPYYYLKKVNKNKIDIIVRVNKLCNIKIITNAYPLYFIENTQILTSNGYKNISELTSNDLILNTKFEKILIESIEKDTYANSVITNPYILKKNSVLKNYPDKDIIMSPNIQFKNKKKWIKPRLIKNLKQENNMININYYKINIKNNHSHNVIINSGIICKI